MRVKIEGDNEPQPTIPHEEGQVPFVFVGTVESIANAKILLQYHLAHLKVSYNIIFLSFLCLPNSICAVILNIKSDPDYLKNIVCGADK